MMIHVVDAAGSEGRDPVDDIHKINAELEAYNPEIAERPQVIAANKTDLIYDAKTKIRLQGLKDEFEPKGIQCISYLRCYRSRDFKSFSIMYPTKLPKLDETPVCI